MLSRGYNPKDLPDAQMKFGVVKEWQTLEQQVEILKAKGCKCKL